MDRGDDNVLFLVKVGDKEDFLVERGDRGEFLRLLRGEGNGSARFLPETLSSDTRLVADDRD